MKAHSPTPKVHNGIDPSFHNARALLKRIDALQDGPKWDCDIFELTGNEIDEKGEFRTEKVELWHRDPTECIRELFGNPSFKGKQGYQPVRVFRNDDGTNREYSEMWTANWWWEIQVTDYLLIRCSAVF